VSDAGRLYSAFDGDPSRIVDYLRRLARERRLAEPVRVLDVGAGVGRMVAPLRALGWEVTATEPDPDYRVRLAEVGAAHGAAVTPEAFNDLRHDGEFTLAIAVNSAFAHVLTPAARADAFHRLHRALRPGGVLLLDLPNFLWILKNYRHPEALVREADGREIRLVHHHEIDYVDATFTTDQEYVVAEPDGRETRTWKRHVYAMTALPDLLHLLREAGFGEVEVHDGFASRAPGRLDGPRMLITARRMPA
jgi:SAM-dependent methyltransferase